MVERRWLSSKFVDECKPPTQGERWVADTKLRSFGLRLWAGKKGGGKAYGIRIKNLEGKALRKTYDPFWPRDISWNSFREWYSPLRLGRFLDDARNWARDEIDRENGRLTLDEEDKSDRAHADTAIRRVTLEVAANSILRGMEARGLSDAYRDRLSKLFSQWVPDRIKQLSLEQVPVSAVADILLDHSQYRGNFMVLRGFLVQIFNSASHFHRPFIGFGDELSMEINAKWEERAKVLYPEILNFEKPVIEAVKSHLSKERDKWQQAYCILAYLEFGAPLSRVMAARWDQIIDDRWYPYLPREKVYWFESKEHIKKSGRVLLNRIRDLATNEFGDSPFWFPSRHGRKRAHIRTVDTLWRYTIHDLKLPYVSLYDFSQRWRQPNRPSYMISFLRQYAETFREIGNAPEIAQILSERKLQRQDSLADK